MTEHGYHPNRDAFITPHIVDPETSDYPYTESATPCPGRNIAVELLTQALHAHTVLSQEADSPILMEPSETLNVPKELRAFVRTLYEQQKENHQGTS